MARAIYALNIKLNEEEQRTREFLKSRGHNPKKAYLVGAEQLVILETAKDNKTNK